MSRKSLYNENEAYTIEAVALDDATEAAVKKLFDEYVEKGYSVRDIARVMQTCIYSLESETILDLRLEKYKKKD